MDKTITDHGCRAAQAHGSDASQPCRGCAAEERSGASISRSSRFARTLVSLCIAGALFAQALAGSGALVRVAGLERADAWPFLDYAMFREAHYTGETATTWRIDAHCESGAVVLLDPLEPAIAPGLDVCDLTAALVTGNAKAARDWCHSFGVAGGDRVAGIDLFEIDYVLSSDGFTLASNQHARTLSMTRPVFEALTGPAPILAALEAPRSLPGPVSFPLRSSAGGRAGGIARRR